jgi:hypothetical protein
VLLQVLHERNLGIVAGPYTTVTSRLGATSAKKYLEAAELRGIDWAGKSANVKDAILVSTAALAE